MIAIAVGVGVSVSKNKSSSSSSSSSNGSTTSDPNDPSKFSKDARLKKSFWALAYTPEGSLIPDCGNSLGARLPAVPMAVRVLMWFLPCRESHHRCAGTCGSDPLGRLLKADEPLFPQLISQLTPRLRLYGADCNQSALVVR